MKQVRGARQIEGQVISLIPIGLVLTLTLRDRDGQWNLRFFSQELLFNSFFPVHTVDLEVPRGNWRYPRINYENTVVNKGLFISWKNFKASLNDNEPTTTRPQPPLLTLLFNNEV